MKSFIPLVLFLSWGVAFLGCEKKPDRQEQIRIQEEMSFEKIQAFQKKHSASYAWWNILQNFDAPFSIDIEEALTVGNGNSKLLVAELADLSKSGDEITAHFSEWVGLSTLMFRLSISPELLGQIRSELPKDERFLPRFVLAFQPDAVSKPIFQAKAQGLEEGHAEMQLDESDVTIITGHCTALEYLGPNGISLEEYSTRDKTNE
jgi:hypothetical protein